MLHQLCSRKSGFRLAFSIRHPAIGKETVRYEASGSLNNFPGAWRAMMTLIAAHLPELFPKIQQLSDRVCETCTNRAHCEKKGNPKQAIDCTEWDADPDYTLWELE